MFQVISHQERARLVVVGHSKALILLATGVLLGAVAMAVSPALSPLPLANAETGLPIGWQAVTPPKNGCPASHHRFRLDCRLASLPAP